MKAELEAALSALIKKTKDEPEPHKAMQYAQAALNLAHAYATVKNAE